MSEDISPINATHLSVAKIFSDDFEFEIPHYQRPYAWEEEQAAELLDDLQHAASQKEPYFLGSIVLIKKPTEKVARVVDGQQRLTTLTILMAVLRDLTENEDRRIGRQKYIYQKEDPDAGTRERFRLLLRDKDRAFFKKHVQEDGGSIISAVRDGLSESQLRVAENTKKLRTLLSENNASAHDRDTLVSFILQSCYLVVVSVPSQKTARKVFTVLNARGLDLTPTDILKADILERGGDALERDLATKWEDIELALGREQFVRLFTDIRMMYQRDKARTSLEDGFPKYVEPFNGNPQNFVDNVLTPLSEKMLLLADLNEIQNRFDEDTRSYIHSLWQINNRDWIAVTLYTLWKFSDENKIRAQEVIKGIERLAYFYLVTGKTLNERISGYAAVMNAIDDELGSGEIDNESLDLSDKEKLNFIEWLDGDIYSYVKLRKPLLIKLDKLFSDNQQDYTSTLTVEHVLPQTVAPESKWQILFPDKDEREEWTNKLANLVLLTHRANSAARNWDFDRKISEYFESKRGRNTFGITQTVIGRASKQTKWTPKILKKRQRKILRRFAKTWDMETVLEQYEKI